MNFKIGDKVRVKGAEPVGKITDVYTGVKWVAQFDEWSLFQGEIEALGIELELVEPALPEEPPVGATFVFPTTAPFCRVTSEQYFCIGAPKSFSWKELVKFYGPNITILEERDKTIREVIQLLKGDESPSSFDWLAEHFGVSLDD